MTSGKRPLPNSFQMAQSPSAGAMAPPRRVVRRSRRRPTVAVHVPAPAHDRACRPYSRSGLCGLRVARAPRSEWQPRQASGSARGSRRCWSWRVNGSRHWHAQSVKSATARTAGSSKEQDRQGPRAWQAARPVALLPHRPPVRRHSWQWPQAESQTLCVRPVRPRLGCRLRPTPVVCGQCITSMLYSVKHP